MDDVGGSCRNNGQCYRDTDRSRCSGDKLPSLTRLRTAIRRTPQMQPAVVLLHAAGN